jgi:cbb3-type cytochrome oxidase subunit 3
MSIVKWLEHYSVVIMTVIFVAIVVSTYWPGRKASIEKQGRIPLEDDV